MEIWQYMAIFFNFSPTLNYLHPLQVGNCDSNSRLVADEDDNGKFRLERVNPYNAEISVCPSGDSSVSPPLPKTFLALPLNVAYINFLIQIKHD